MTTNYSIDNGTFEKSELYAKQREERGFDDTECWNLDSTIAKFILPRLKVFKEIHHGYPAELGEEEWENVLDKMIDTFSDIVTHDDWELTFEELKEREAKINEGLSLFAKYYRDLWD